MHVPTPDVLWPLPTLSSPCFLSSDLWISLGSLSHTPSRRRTLAYFCFCNTALPVPLARLPSARSPGCKLPCFFLSICSEHSSPRDTWLPFCRCSEWCLLSLCQGCLDHPFFIPSECSRGHLLRFPKPSVQMSRLI